MKATTIARPESSNPGRLGPWRSACQWLGTLIVLLVPWIPAGGDTLLRLDFPTLTLHAGGHVFPIETLSLFLLLAIILILLFLLVTLAFGRAWCGWACPQTTLVDLVEWFARRIGAKVSAGAVTAGSGRKTLIHLFSLALALLVGMNVAWYFVSPYEFFPRLFSGTLHWVTWLTMGGTALLVAVDLLFLRRLFCKEFCPYGRFQTVLVDAGTLTLRYHPDEAPRCIRCGACVRACPTGIDIRDGYQIECINCGRCLDACRQVMARRHQAGIIRYTFGSAGLGPRALLNPRMALVAVALLGMSIALGVAAGERSSLSLKVARNAALLPRAVGGETTANFYTLHLVNRNTSAQAVMLAVDSEGAEVLLSGPELPLQLKAGEKRETGIALRTPSSSLPRTVTLTARDAAGRQLASETLRLLAPVANH